MNFCYNLVETDIHYTINEFTDLYLKHINLSIHIPHRDILLECMMMDIPNIAYTLVSKYLNGIDINEFFPTLIEGSDYENNNGVYTLHPNIFEMIIIKYSDMECIKKLFILKDIIKYYKIYTDHIKSKIIIKFKKQNTKYSKNIKYIVESHRSHSVEATKKLNEITQILLNITHDNINDQ